MSRDSFISNTFNSFNLHTPTNALIYIYIYIYICYLRSLKFYIKTLKTLLHVSILRSFSGNTYCSLLKIYTKIISDLLCYINFGDVAACLVFVCASYTACTYIYYLRSLKFTLKHLTLYVRRRLYSVRRTYKHTTCCHITKVNVTKQITNCFSI